MFLNTYLEELTSVLVAVVNANGASAETEVKADSEISWLKWHLGSVLLDHHLSLQEDTLRSTRIGLLWLNELNGPVLEVVEDDELANAIVLES